MIKNFEDKVILTSQYPEAFLTFSYESDVRYVDASIDASISNIYINGWTPAELNTADTSSALILDANKEIAPFHIFTDSAEALYQWFE